MDVVSFDYDSTLACTRHRWHMVDETPREQRDRAFWERYSLACPDDTPGPALPLAQLLSKINFPFIVTSARAEVARPASLKWLWDRSVYPWAMYLCDERHDYMPHDEWKATRLKEIQAETGWNILFHVDDVDSVGKAIQNIGIPAMMIHEVGTVADHLG